MKMGPVIQCEWEGKKGNLDLAPDFSNLMKENKNLTSSHHSHDSITLSISYGRLVFQIMVTNDCSPNIWFNPVKIVLTCIYVFTMLYLGTCALLLCCASWGNWVIYAVYTTANPKLGEEWFWQVFTKFGEGFSLEDQSIIQKWTHFADSVNGHLAFQTIVYDDHAKWWFRENSCRNCGNFLAFFTHDYFMYEMVSIAFCNTCM